MNKSTLQKIRKQQAEQLPITNTNDFMGNSIFYALFQEDYELLLEYIKNDLKSKLNKNNSLIKINQNELVKDLDPEIFTIKDEGKFLYTKNEAIDLLTIIYSINSISDDLKEQYTESLVKSFEITRNPYKYLVYKGYGYEEMRIIVYEIIKNNIPKLLPELDNINRRYILQQKKQRQQQKQQQQKVKESQSKKTVNSKKKTLTQEEIKQKQKEQERRRLQGKAERRRLKIERNAATTIHRYLRDHQVRQTQKRKRKAATTMQRHVRGQQVRQTQKRKRNAATNIQRVLRGKRNRNSQTRKIKAATKIQSMQRAMRNKNITKRLKQEIISQKEHNAIHKRGSLNIKEILGSDKYNELMRYYTNEISGKNMYDENSVCQSVQEHTKTYYLPNKNSNEDKIPHIIVCCIFHFIGVLNKVLNDLNHDIKIILKGGRALQLLTKKIDFKSESFDIDIMIKHSSGNTEIQNIFAINLSDVIRGFASSTSKQDLEDSGIIKVSYVGDNGYEPLIDIGYKIPEGTDTERFFVNPDSHEINYDKYNKYGKYDKYEALYLTQTIEQFIEEKKYIIDNNGIDKQYETMFDINKILLQTLQIQYDFKHIYESMKQQIEAIH